MTKPKTVGKDFSVLKKEERDFRNTVMARAEHDPEFRDALLKEAQELQDSGDLEICNALRRLAK